MLDENEWVILVDESDQSFEFGPKLGTHETGALHRAISVFVFNTSGELLLQKRAACKYHSAGKWANTCCGHPRPNESSQSAAERRLYEEMGMRVDLKFGFKSRYEARLDNDMIENEIPYLYFGVSDSLPQPNPDEVSAFEYVRLEHINDELKRDAGRFSAWLIHYMDSHTNRISSYRDVLVAEMLGRQSGASALA